MNNYSEAIEALNDLIQINNDRVEGYQRAIDEMKEANNTITSSLFERYMKDSQTNIVQLSEYITQMGGTPTDSTTFGGKLHRMWMDIKSTFAVHEKESTLLSCIFGDEAAIKAYQSALADPSNNLPTEVSGTLKRHLLTIEATHTANVAYEKTLEAINA